MIFTVNEPPKATGNINEDFNRLSEWCDELYEYLWQYSFRELQYRKNLSKGDEEGEG